MAYEKKKVKKGIYVIGVVILIALIVVLYIINENSRFKKEYNEAWDIAMSGKTDEAKQLFYKLDNKYSKKYNTLKFSANFCDLIDYEKEGNYRNGKQYLDNWVKPRLENRDDLILNEKQSRFVDKVVASIEENYTAHKAEYDEEDRLREEENAKYKAEKEARIEAEHKRAPYVGMPESQIDKTDLGEHSRYYAHFNNQKINGKVYSASYYEWFKGNDCIYTARCVRGEVWSVWDNTDRHVKNNIVDHSVPSRKSKKKESTTEFDIDDHDIEAYYEDYKDIEGFESIEDAEDDFEDNPEYWDEY